MRLLLLCVPLVCVLISCGGDSDSQPECGLDVAFNGYNYATVEIGNQCWFAENLRSTQYANGDEIFSELSDEEWAGMFEGATTVYAENNVTIYDGRADAAANLADYGRLYNWWAVADERGICPSGWHVPSDEEFKILEMTLGMTLSEADSLFERGTDQGKRLKSSSTDDPAWNGTNTEGFKGLPAGGRIGGDFTGFTGEGQSQYFWTSSIESATSAWRRDLFEGDGIRRGGGDRHQGYSCRCVRD